MLLSELPLLKKITLRIEKPWAPVGLPLDTVAVEITRSWHTAYVAFGSNLGDKKKYLDNGIQGLKDTPGCEVEAVSKYLVTEPYGGVEQDEFLNGVLRLRTLLTPEELLDRLHELEAEANRERLIHWGHVPWILTFSFMTMRSSTLRIFTFRISTCKTVILC